MSKKRRRGRGEGAAFYSESKGCWVGRVAVGVKPSGGVKYREVTARTKGELLARLRGADAPPPGALTVGRHLRDWLEACRPSVEATSHELYERTVRLHLVPHLGAFRLAALAARDVEAFLAARVRAGASRALAAQVAAVLATALAHAVRVGAIPRSPMAGVVPPRPAAAEVVPFTPAEAAAIMAEAARSRLGPAAALAFATGARLGELLGLGWGHLDLGKGVMRVERSLARTRAAGLFLKPPKTKRGRRSVSLPAFAVEAMAGLRARMLAEGNAGSPAFCTRPGNHVRPANLQAAWRRWLAAAGVPYRKFHAVRHTHISELLAAGESVVDVARRVGDRPEVILRVYAHYVPGGGEARVAGRLEAMYGGGGGDGRRESV